MTYGNHKPVRILTFDIEEWFSWDPHGLWRQHETRLQLFLPRLLDFLEASDVRATFFCLGWIATEFPEIVRAIASRGHEIGCHSHGHRWVHTMTPQEFVADLRQALDALEACIGAKVTAYRAPAFSITDATPWAFDCLADQGIRYDCSVFPAPRDFGGMPRCSMAGPFTINTRYGMIREFPMSVGRIGWWRVACTGGGYFRLFPYSFIQRVVNRADYTMVYLHLHDFDALGPMRAGCRGLRRWKARIGRAGSWLKFQRFASAYSWLGVSQASQQIDWATMPKLTVS